MSDDLLELARFMGVATQCRDGLKQDIVVGSETLVTVCAALGAPIHKVGDAASALRSQKADRSDVLVSPVLVAWDGKLGPIDSRPGGARRAVLTLADGSTRSVEISEAAALSGSAINFPDPIPPGYHQLQVEHGSRTTTSTVVSAPEDSWHPPGDRRSWGISAHLAALRSSRSRSATSPTLRPSPSGSAHAGATCSAFCHCFRRSTISLRSPARTRR